MAKAITARTTKTFKEDQRIAFALISPFVIGLSHFLIRGYFGFSAPLISRTVMFLFFLAALSPVLKRSMAVSFMYIFILFMTFLSNYLIFVENRLFLKNIFLENIFQCFPLFIYSYSLNNWIIFKKTLQKASQIMLLIGFTVFFLKLGNHFSISRYNMSFSYFMLIPTIVFIEDFLRNFNYLSLFSATFSSLFIITLGARGPLLSVFVFFLLTSIIGIHKFLKRSGKYNHTKLEFFLTTFILSIIAFRFYQPILSLLSKTLLHFGIRSRTISIILTNPLHLSGRSDIYSTILNTIGDKPFLGIGMAGDRTLLGSAGHYSHNIFLEILSGFGIIGGTIIILLLIFLVVRTLCGNIQLTTGLPLIWFSIGFVPLLFSGSYLTFPTFWIYLGISLKSYKRGKQYSSGYYYILSDSRCTK